MENGLSELPQARLIRVKMGRKYHPFDSIAPDVGEGGRIDAVCADERQIDADIAGLLRDRRGILRPGRQNDGLNPQFFYFGFQARQLGRVVRIAGLIG